MAKRIKYVHPTARIAHLWAHQAQDSARNGRNHSFEGKYLFSYSTKIATLIVGKKPSTVRGVLLCSRDYSSTTRQHKWAARSAVTAPVFEVPDIFVDDFPSRHVDNINYYRSHSLEALANGLTCQGVNIPSCIGNGQNWIDKLNSYCKFFKLGKRFKLDRDTLAKVEARNARLNSPEKIAERARTAAQATDLARRLDEARDTARRNDLMGMAQQYLQGVGEIQPYRFNHLQWIADDECRKLWQDVQAMQTTRAAERLQKWMKGEIEISYYDSDIRELQYAYARIVGDEIQTTKGASVPIEHVAKVMPLLRRLLESGKTYKRNGHSIHLGHYVIDALDEKGMLTVGCHRFERAEMERLFALIDALPNWTMADTSHD